MVRPLFRSSFKTKVKLVQGFLINQTCRTIEKTFTRKLGSDRKPTFNTLRNDARLKPMIDIK